MLFIDRKYKAYLDGWNCITVLIPLDDFEDEQKVFYLHLQEKKIQLKIDHSFKVEKYMKYSCSFQEAFPFGEVCYMEDEAGVKTDVQIGAVIRTKEFDEAFYYEGRLGPQYDNGEIVCKLWAPAATSVKLKLIHPVTNEEKLFTLTRGDKGVWRSSISSKYLQWTYTFLVCNNLIWKEAEDPYGAAVTVNGTKSVLLDPRSIIVEKYEVPALQKPTDAVIYELHIRDFSIHPDSGIQNKGKYAAFSEVMTATHSGFSTGIAYLKEMGVTHIELLPFNDFGGVDEEHPEKSYNWGYNPLHFNAVEGSYSTDPHNPGTRIQEAKEMVQQLHQHGFKVIADVVYNHVFLRETCPFEKTVPGYFFRHDENGFPSNGTGVGNDIASERKMVQKYICDSIAYWIEQYDVDGFRFDLMGILDTETMNKIQSIARTFKSDILILGEGWDLPTPLAHDRKATMANSGAIKDIAFFNDRFRDVIKGSTFQAEDCGFALGNEHTDDEVKQLVAGSKHYFSLTPSTAVNYVESHDNHTFWDKALLCRGDMEEQELRERQKLATSMVLLSQGIPFLHAGQEFYRTKKGEENSYQSPDDINRLDWERREAYAEDIKYIQKLIALRKENGAFRFADQQQIDQHIDIGSCGRGKIVIHYHHIQDYCPWNCMIVVFSSTRNREVLPLPSSGWKIFCTPDRVHEGGTMVESSDLSLEQIGTYILYKE
ncbi:type I pullulanase [Bacillus lacus]|uniref:Type I pullulanase n=1 Tax=Metabacillus lacus TaxID=1983721 RepID=A0A7X2IZV7_9BACI|nr:type I pullulanase [Metabacillus lacus]MRX72704.1 type I pullulanase [Metabacillus lacus]